MKKDEVAMLKSTGIKIDDDKTLVAIVDYHTEKEIGFDGKEHVSKGKSFYRTDLIVRTNQEWKDLIAKFEGDPGREFKCTDMGLEIPGGEWRCGYSRKRWTWRVGSAIRSWCVRPMYWAAGAWRSYMTTKA